MGKADVRPHFVLGIHWKGNSATGARQRVCAGARQLGVLRQRSHHGRLCARTAQILSQLTAKQHQIGSRDFRIRPDIGTSTRKADRLSTAETETTGNCSACKISQPALHYVLADHQIRRNPNLLSPDPKHQVVHAPQPASLLQASQLQKRLSQLQPFWSIHLRMLAHDLSGRLLVRAGDEQHAFHCKTLP